MGDLTENLSRHEFACKCGCGFDVVDYKLADILQETADSYLSNTMMEDVVGVYLTINSGCRCPAHNKAEGGSENSRHMLGNAADFKVKFRMSDGTKYQIPPTRIANNLDRLYPTLYGIGWYNGRTHFDTSSSGRRRWDLR